MTSMGSVLSLDSVIAGYRNKPVLNGVSINVAAEEIVALIGHNGAGKSTLLKCAFGLVRPRSGRVVVFGRTLENAPPSELLRTGVAYIPQGNRVFDELTVQENLELANTIYSEADQFSDTLERVFTRFPILRDRLKQQARVLSGGEKQMLAFASALVLRPRLLLMDEPSLGLGPKLVHKVLDQIVDIRNTWRTTVLIVEQKVRDVLKISDRVYVLRNGSVSFSGPSSQLQDETTLREAYF